MNRIPKWHDYRWAEAYDVFNDASAHLPMDVWEYYAERVAIVATRLAEYSWKQIEDAPVYQETEF